MAVRRRLPVRVHGHGAALRGPEGLRSLRHLRLRPEALQPRRRGPPLPGGPRGPRPHARAGRAVLLRRAREPPLGRQPDALRQRRELHPSPRRRAAAQRHDSRGPLGLVDGLQDQRLRPAAGAERPARPPVERQRHGELGLRVWAEGGHHLETARPRRPALAGAESGSRHGNPRAAPPSGRPEGRLGRAAQLGVGHRPDAGHQPDRLDDQRVRPQPELHADQPAQLGGQLRDGVHLGRQHLPGQPADPPLERCRLLQRRPDERHRLLGLRGHVDRRVTGLGVLRRDPPHVVERHGQHRPRGDRERRVGVPPRQRHPRQHQEGRTSLAGDRGLSREPDRPVQPDGLREGHEGPGKSRGPLRLAAAQPRVAGHGGGPGDR